MAGRKESGHGTGNQTEYSVEPVVLFSVFP